MDQSIDAFLHLDKQAEVGEVAHLSAVLRLHRELELDVVPWIWNELLHAQAHLPLFAVDAQDDGLDLVSHFQELLRTAQVLAPAHFADVQQTFDTFRHFDESTVVCNNHNFSFDLVSDVDAFRHGIPWVRSQLLNAKRNALAVVVEVEDHNVQALVHFDHLFWVVHTAPAEVCDVHQSVHATKVDEDTVRSDVLDHTFEYLALFETTDDLTLLLLQLGLDKRLV